MRQRVFNVLSSLLKLIIVVMDGWMDLLQW